MSETNDMGDAIRSHYRRPLRFRVAVLAVIVAGVVVASLVIRSQESGPKQIAIQSPINTTLSWFAAINARDMPLALAHFVPVDRDMMEWSSWGVPFEDVHCSLMNRSTARASVYCTFNDINDANMGMSNVSFWTASLQRERSGRWLINNYGQG